MLCDFSVGFLWLGNYNRLGRVGILHIYIDGSGGGLVDWSCDGLGGGLVDWSCDGLVWVVACWLFLWWIVWQTCYFYDGLGGGLVDHSCDGLGGRLVDCSWDGLGGGLVGYSCDGLGGKLDCVVDWVMHMLTVPVMECMVGLLTIPAMDWVVDVLINGWLALPLWCALTVSSSCVAGNGRQLLPGGREEGPGQPGGACSGQLRSGRHQECQNGRPWRSVSLRQASFFFVKKKIFF